MVEVNHEDVGPEVVEQRLVKHRALGVRSGKANKDDGFVANRVGDGFGLCDAFQLCRQWASSPVPGSH